MTNRLDLVVRAADARDAPDIVRICTGPVANKQTFIAQSFDRRSVLGAYRGEQIVGCLIWDRTFFGRPFVWLLGVDPAARRQGIASILLMEFDRTCAAEPRFTSTNESNHAMHDLLARSGYARSGSVDNIDPGDPEIFYFKPPGHALL